MTPMPVGLFVKKLQPKVGLGRYYILFAYFVVEAKSKSSHETTLGGTKNKKKKIGTYCFSYLSFKILTFEIRR